MGLFQPFLLLAGLILGCEAVQRFSEVPEYTETNPGAAAVLRCRVAEKADASECVWQQNGLPVLPRAGKYEWAGQVDEGDCSLRVLRTNIAYDDGEWRCQVTSSSYQAGDGLSSEPARLVVRQPPDQPRIFLANSSSLVTGELQVKEGQEEFLECRSINGNPAPEIVWFLGDAPLAGGEQTNRSDGGRWTAKSRLAITPSRDQDGEMIRCSVRHPALPRRIIEESVRVSVLFPPAVQLERSPPGEEAEEGSSVVLACKATGNPSPSVLWRKLGHSSIFRVEPELRFPQVREEDGGTYVCVARNEVGTSDELTAELTVRFPPRNVNTDPARLLDLEVGQSKSMRCSAEGSPAPRLEWLQLVDGGTGQEKVFSRGRGGTLTISNATYKHQGLWRCSATNKIGGEERVAASPVVRIGVTGRPLPREGSQDGGGLPGEATTLVQQFCADPPANQVRWEWGSLRLDAGRRKGRFNAKEPESVAGSIDCYSASLQIEEATPEDSRQYRLVVENVHGAMAAPVQLTVEHPLSMATVIGLAAVGLLFTILASVLAIMAQRKRWWCWGERKGRFEPQPDIKIERRVERQESEQGSIGERTLPLTQGLGREVTYQGHAGLGRPVPAPLYPVPRKTPQNADSGSGSGTDHGGGELIRPRRVFGVPTMYADLQFPRSSNFGSMKRRGEAEALPPSHPPSHYARIQFSPNRREKADL